MNKTWRNYLRIAFGKPNRPTKTHIRWETVHDCAVCCWRGDCRHGSAVNVQESFWLPFSTNHLDLWTKSSFAARRHLALCLERVPDVFERTHSDIYRQVEHNTVQSRQESDHALHAHVRDVARVRVMVGDEGGRARYEAYPAWQTAGVESQTDQGCETESSCEWRCLHKAPVDTIREGHAKRTQHSYGKLKWELWNSNANRLVFWNNLPHNRCAGAYRG